MAWGAVASLGTSGGSGGGSLFGNLLNNVNIGSYARRNNGKYNSKTWKDWGMSNITGDMFSDREADYRDKENREAMVEASKSGGTINYYATPSSSQQQSSSGGGGMGGFDLGSMFGGGGQNQNQQSSGGGLDMNSLMSLINMFSRSKSAGQGNSGIALPANANVTNGTSSYLG